MERRGWAEITADDLPGAITISWDAPAEALIARAIAKRRDTPNELLGRFLSYLSYLLERRRKQISSTLIRPA